MPKLQSCLTSFSPYIYPTISTSGFPLSGYLAHKPLNHRTCRTITGCVPFIGCTIHWVLANSHLNKLQLFRQNLWTEPGSWLYPMKYLEIPALHLGVMKILNDLTWSIKLHKMITMLILISLNQGCQTRGLRPSCVMCWPCPHQVQ